MLQANELLLQEMQELERQIGVLRKHSVGFTEYKKNIEDRVVKNFYKDKYSDLVYNDFRESAIEGVKLISEKKLLPINYSCMENMSKGLYIYDNIFLSILEDSYDFQVIFY